MFGYDGNSIPGRIQDLAGCVRHCVDGIVLARLQCVVADIVCLCRFRSINRGCFEKVDSSPIMEKRYSASIVLVRTVRGKELMNPHPQSSSIGAGEEWDGVSNRKTDQKRFAATERKHIADR